MRRFLPRVTTAAALLVVTVLAVATAAAPAGAQQLVDAGKQGDGSGGLAFVLFAVMVACCALALFYMDRVRRRKVDQEDRPR